MYFFDTEPEETPAAAPAPDLDADLDAEMKKLDAETMKKTLDDLQGHQ